MPTRRSSRLARTAALLLCPIVLAACGTARHGTPAAPTVAYACDDGTVLRVRFDNEDGLAEVTLPDGGQLRLPQQRAASGIWYATPQHELRGKGDEARWTVGRRVPVACRVQR